jgi:hypothetical protein
MFISKKTIITWSISFIVSFITLVIFMPMWSDYSSRTESYKILKHLERAKKEIEARFMNQRDHVNIGKDVSIESSPIIGRAFVSPDGIIFAQGEAHGQIMILIPSYSNGKMSWSCWGGSFKDVPFQCRN